MQKKKFDIILEQIAQINQVSTNEIRTKMQLAMESALKDPSPEVQSMWNSIPRTGDSLTLEEFMDYLFDQNLMSL